MTEITQLIFPRGKQPCHPLAIWILQFFLAAPLLVAAPVGPEIAVSHQTDGRVRMSWKTHSVTSGTPAIFPAYQLQISTDLENWQPLGDPIPTAIGGESAEHSVELPDLGRSAFARLSYRVELSGEELGDADLRGADLRGADLAAVDLNGAMLTGADLRGADLGGAELEGANLSGAQLGDTRMAGVRGNVIIRNLGGDDGSAPAIQLPFYPYEPRSADYDEHHPLFGVASFNTLVVVPSQEATLGDLNGLFEQFNAQLVSSLPGAAGVGGSVMGLRFPTQDHEQLAAIAEALTAHASVDIAIPDSADEAKIIPTESQALADWDWDTAGGGNWGHEACQIPLLWNFRDALAKSNGFRPVGVIDGAFGGGFDADLVPIAFHEDVPVIKMAGDQPLPPTPIPRGSFEHGNHVAGIIAAVHGNGLGTEGIYPFAGAPLCFGPLDGLMSDLWQFGSVASLTASGVTAINISLGKCPPLQDPNTHTSWQTHMNDLGAAATAFMTGLEAKHGQVPTICVAAGNESNGAKDCKDKPLPYSVLVDSRWLNTWANAARNHALDNVIIVEADGVPNANNPDYSALARASFSNGNGHIGAPGVAIRSASWPEKLYENKSGTSMATPHITAIVAFLKSLDDTLTHSEIRTLMATNGLPVSGSGTPAPMVQAWTSAMEIDRLRGGDRILRMLLDIDDGTPDGNLRMNAGGGDNIEMDADGDGGRGDGVIDMSDFRCFRDWFLAANFADRPNFELDGSTVIASEGISHPKRDLNGDGEIAPNGVAARSFERYPRGDFNGDGILDTGVPEADRSPVPGALAGQSRSDFGVLTSRINDPLYPQADLVALQLSGDIHVEPRSLFNQFPDAQTIVSTIAEVVNGAAQPVTAGPTSFTHDRTPENGAFIYTVPTGLETPRNYRVTLEVRDGAGAVLDSRSDDFEVKLGGDHHYFKPQPLEETSRFHQTRVKLEYVDHLAISTRRNPPIDPISDVATEFSSFGTQSPDTNSAEVSRGDCSCAGSFEVTATTARFDASYVNAHALARVYSQEELEALREQFSDPLIVHASHQTKCEASVSSNLSYTYLAGQSGTALVTIRSPDEPSTGTFIGTASIRQGELSSEVRIGVSTEDPAAFVKEDTATLEVTAGEELVISIGFSYRDDKNTTPTDGNASASATISFAPAP